MKSNKNKQDSRKGAVEPIEKRASDIERAIIGWQQSPIVGQKIPQTIGREKVMSEFRSFVASEEKRKKV